MRKQNFLTSGFLIPLILMIGGIVTAADRSELSVQVVCSYSDYCDRLKRKPDGSIIQPDPQLLTIVKDLAYDIHVTAKKFDVDPVLIAATIVAENTMNVNVSDKVQNWLVANSVLPTGTVLGKSFSLGLGQIRTASAYDVEHIVAKMESRPPHPDTGELSRALLTPQGSFTYNAAILRDAIDRYKAIGIDISQRPAILATLYNLGRVSRRVEMLRNQREHAAKTNQKPPEPRPNYFGYFVGKHYDLIAKELGTEEEAKKRQELKALVSTVKTPARLMKLPPLCDPKKGLSPDNTTDATGSGRYRVLARTIDCDMSPFSLVEFENGSVGWMLSEQLDRLTVKVANSKPHTCKAKFSLDCRHSIERISQYPFSDPDGSLLYLYTLSPDSSTSRGSRRTMIRDQLYPVGNPDREPMSESTRDTIIQISERLRTHILNPAVARSANIPDELPQALNDWIKHIRSCQPACALQGTTASQIYKVLDEFKAQPHLSQNKKNIEALVQTRPVRPKNPLYAETFKKAYEQCGPMIAAAKALSDHTDPSYAETLVTTMKLLSATVPLAPTETIDQSKYKTTVLRLIEQVRQECSAFATCESGKLGGLLSGTQCKLERDLQKLDFLCQFGRPGIFARVENYGQQISCFFPNITGSSQRNCRIDSEDLLERTQELSDLSCVKRVIVPSRHVAGDVFSQQNDKFRSKVVFGEVIAGRIAVQLEEECTAEAK